MLIRHRYCRPKLKRHDAIARRLPLRIHRNLGKRLGAPGTEKLERRLSELV